MRAADGFGKEHIQERYAIPVSRCFQLIPRPHEECGAVDGEEIPAVAEPTWRGATYKHDKIRVAYVSSDFRQHAIGFLVVGMIESHDKSLFEISAISTSPGDGSQTRNRLEQSFDAFIDASALSEKKRSIC